MKENIFSVLSLATPGSIGLCHDISFGLHSSWWLGVVKSAESDYVCWDLNSGTTPGILASPPPGNLGIGKK